MNPNPMDLAQLVRDALALVGGIDQSYLWVQATNGVVTLGGIAFSDEERRRAADVARQIPGVMRVVNEIVVVTQPGA